MSPRWGLVATAGFAMFSMFFGSGNLVFPLDIGRMATSEATWAAVGIVLTGVFVPFLGLYGIILYEGSYEAFLGRAGKTAAFVSTLLILALMGPVGVIPRCIIVAHGGVALFAPNLSVALFSAIFCLITLLVIWRHDLIVPILGTVLTPVLLLGMAVLVAVGLAVAPDMPQSALSSLEAFRTGFDGGYQMMDLMAAFFFSGTTVTFLRRRLAEEGASQDEARRLSLYASFLGAGLLAAVYLCFVFLGAYYSEAMGAVGAEQILAQIAAQALGPYSGLVASVIILLACLSTATVLAILFAEFFEGVICRGRISGRLATVLTLVVSFGVSLVGFNPLKVWIGTALVIAYPALIVLTLWNIADRLWGLKGAKWGFWLTLTASALLSVV